MWSKASQWTTRPLTVLFPKLTSSLLQLLTQHPATRFLQAPLGDFRCVRCVSDVFLIRTSESGNRHPEKWPGNIPRPRSLQKFFQRSKTSEKNCFYTQVRGNGFCLHPAAQKRSSPNPPRWNLGKPQAQWYLSSIKPNGHRIFLLWCIHLQSDQMYLFFLGYIISGATQQRFASQQSFTRDSSSH